MTTGSGAVYLLIDLTIDEVELAEPHDVKRLHVAVAHGSDQQAVDALLARTGAGTPIDGDDDHIWVSVAWIREHARGRVDGRWSEDLDHLIDRARQQGRIDETGTRVRSRIEWLAAGEEST